MYYIAYINYIATIIYYKLIIIITNIIIIIIIIIIFEQLYSLPNSPQRSWPFVWGGHAPDDGTRPKLLDLRMLSCPDSFAQRGRQLQRCSYAWFR